MTRIKGITVTLYDKTQTGTDDFNRPIYEEKAVTVQNVLVGLPAKSSLSDDITNEMNLSGKQVKYVLAIPKGDTHDWEDKTVEFFGCKFHTVGTTIQGIEDNIPLDWNKKIAVERYISEE